MKPELPDRYALEGADYVLGEGGMGTVLRARDTILDLPVALKLVKPQFAKDPRFTRRFDLEVRLAARVAHPNIVPLHDLGTLPDGAPFLGLALADAGNLARYRAEPQDWGTLKRLTLQLLQALAHVHARGVVHRDLKPENVLLHTANGSPSVWLADLGLANAFEALARRRGKREGTPGYMAPEQRHGLVREVGPWTDLFGVGVILWELVTGRLPFPEGTNALDTPLGVLKPRMPVPKGLEVILGNLLAPDPLSRYDLAADLATELDALPQTCTRSALSLVDGQAGTVARAAPRPSGLSRASRLSSITSPESAADADSGDALVGEVGPFDGNVPEWNRPTVPSMPPGVPDEPVGGGAARASLPLFAMRELPLVAREDLRSELWAVAREVSESRRTWVLLLVGEAGSGKTALVESVLHALEEGGWAEPMRMRWHEPPGMEDGYPGAARALLRPWNETRGSLQSRLTRRLARCRGRSDRVVAEEAATLVRWCGMLQPGEEPVASGHGLREIYRELDARSWRSLAVLHLDDAHLGVEDGDGLDIAEGVLQLSAEGIERPLLVLATIRSEELGRDPTLADRLEDLVAAGAVRIDVPRLDRAGTERLLSDSLTLEPELAATVASRCAGNPLFARQLLLEWSSRGWLVDRGGLKFGLAAGVDVDAALPPDVEALFAHRVEALARSSEDAERFMRAVHTVALAGAELNLDLLHRAVADPDLTTYLIGCGLLIRRGATVAFDHGLLHATLRAQALQRNDLVALHAHLAAAWREHGLATGRRVSFEVGVHLHAAGRWADSVVPLLVASARAFDRGAGGRLHEASELALIAAHRGAKEQLGLANLWAARAAKVRGDNKAASESFQQALGVFEEQGNARGAMEALVGLGGALRDAGALQEADRRLHFALSRARAMGSVRGEAEALEGLAWLEQRKRNFAGADLLFTRVLNRAIELEDHVSAASATLGQADLARRRGQFDDAEELYEEAVDGFFDAESPHGVARAQIGLAHVKRQRYDVRTAETLFREAAQSSDELGVAPLVMEARMGLADLHRLQGKYARARGVYESCSRWAERQHAFEMAIHAQLTLAHLALLEDDLRGMYQHARDAAVHLSQVPGHWLWASYRLTVAVLLALRGDEEETYRWLWSASELGLGDSVDQDAAYLLTVLAHTSAGSGWVQPTRIATTLAVDQWMRLGRKREAARVGKALEKLGAA